MIYFNTLGITPGRRNASAFNSDFRREFSLIPLTGSAISGACDNSATGSIHFIHSAAQKAERGATSPDRRS